MNVNIHCPNCDAELALERQWHGHNVECPYCEKKFLFSDDAQDRPPRRKLLPPLMKPAREYKVLTQRDKWFSGMFDPDKLEGAINAYARQGWRVVGCATASVPGLLTELHDELVVIMERN